jgi:hypothetical protein
MNKFFQFPPIAASSALGNLCTTASSGGGANGNLTLPAAPSSLDRRTLHSAVWSYNATPTAGAVRFYNGTTAGTLMCELDVGTAGVDGWVFYPPLVATPGNVITGVITQAGSSVIGRLNAYGAVM